ncbi:hypothetical protein BC832DRAFT_553329 [Gaertneriomyces semiglobifer]|nr:hypothetical protein BC832DRAFT_553329 [Gaertneriomyces semiglobifer]
MALEDLDRIMNSLNQDLSMSMEHSDFKGHCEVCHEPVLNDTGPGVSYTRDGIQHAFHRKCFNCNECKNMISDGSFFFHQNDDGVEAAVCRTCWEERIMGICEGCGQSLVKSGGEVVKVGEGKKYHANCFTCSQCHSPLTRYFQKDSSLFCRSCYESAYSPSCSRCNALITPEEDGKITMVEWKDRKFHQACFNCKQCGKAFEDLKALHHQGELYCKECYVDLIKIMDEQDAKNKS